MHQFRLVFHEGQHPTYIVGDAKRQQSDNKDQEQHPPEAQILYKLLPRGAEAGQDPLPLLQVGIEEGMAFHGAVREAKGKKGHETTHHPFQKQKTKETALFKKTNLKIYACSIHGLGRSPGEGNGNPLQYSGLENFMDCIIHGVSKSWTQVSTGAGSLSLL